MRKTIFADREKYHLFNRGVDKRKIFLDQSDLERFFKSMRMFNSVNPIGSLYEQGFSKKEKEQKEPLIKFIAFCLLPNHFHFIVEQLVEGGISEYMKRLLGGYTWYFNNRYRRAGALFQGAFKAVHIESNEQLLHVSAYVNLNDKQTSLGDRTAKSAKLLVKSSWKEYLNQDHNNQSLCLGKDIIIEQFKNSSEYKDFALASLKDIRLNKEKYKKLEN